MTTAVKRDPVESMRLAREDLAKELEVIEARARVIRAELGEALYRTRARSGVELRKPAQEMVTEFIRNNPGCTFEDIREARGVHEHTARRLLTKMFQGGLVIIKTGREHGTRERNYYYLPFKG